jgi:hypothetical protein
MIWLRCCLPKPTIRPLVQRATTVSNGSPDRLDACVWALHELSARRSSIGVINGAVLNRSRHFREKFVK